MLHDMVKTSAKIGPPLPIRYWEYAGARSISLIQSNQIKSNQIKSNQIKDEVRLSGNKGMYMRSTGAFKRASIRSFVREGISRFSGYSTCSEDILIIYKWHQRYQLYRQQRRQSKYFLVASVIPTAVARPGVAVEF